MGRLIPAGTGYSSYQQLGRELPAPAPEAVAKTKVSPEVAAS